MPGVPGAARRDRRHRLPADRPGAAVAAGTCGGPAVFLRNRLARLERMLPARRLTDAEIGGRIAALCRRCGFDRLPDPAELAHVAAAVPGAPPTDLQRLRGVVEL